MPERWEFEPQPAQSGLRLDRYLSEMLPDQTRSYLQKLLEQGLVSVNGAPADKKTKIRPGMRVECIMPDPEPLEVLPQDIPLDIVYEDEDLLVVNKPKGMVVHPAAGNPDGTLVNALLYHCGSSLSGINGVLRPGIVHRIDKNTSGLLMVAKNDRAHQGLAAQLADHSFLREYRAVVYGRMQDDRGTIHAPIGRSPKDRKKMCVTTQNARDAITHYEVLARYREFTYLKFRLETGRTHQIRVHMAYLGHPLAGDDVYGPKKVITRLNGQCLHAKVLGFVHPTTGNWMQFDSELPPYFTAFLCSLETT